jgi:hypothetical protein
METTLSLIGAVTGIMGFVISVLSYFHNRIDAVNSYLENERAPYFLEARRVLHNTPEGYDPSELQQQIGNQIAFLVTSYEQAAILVKRKQLPFWIFKSQASGFALTRMYDKLRPYIEMRRLDNPAYAKQYEDLYHRIKRAQK